MKVPTLEMVTKKTKQIESAKNFSMNDDDIETVSAWLSLIFNCTLCFIMSRWSKRRRDSERIRETMP